MRLRVVLVLLTLLVLALAYVFLGVQVPPCFAPVGNGGRMICPEAQQQNP